MNKVSVIIPSCNEIYLQKTIDSILENAIGDIEIIVYLDEFWPNPPIKDDDRVILIHHSKRMGMRPAINSCARIATGKYIMKLDAHCTLDKGFDEKLKQYCEYDWLCIPRRYDLCEDTWERGNKVTDYMYLSPPLKKEKDAGKYWERGFHGVRWSKYNDRKDEKGILAKDKHIDDTMSFQGSCWFMHRDYFFELGEMDLNYGYFAQEAQELANKVWLSGGRVIRNKLTWYAHLHKGKKLGRGYFLSRDVMDQAPKFSIDLWMNNKWPKQIHDMKWLVNKFSPVPGWEDYEWK